MIALIKKDYRKMLDQWTASSYNPSLKHVELKADPQTSSSLVESGLIKSPKLIQKASKPFEKNKVRSYDWISYTNKGII